MSDADGISYPNRITAPVIGNEPLRTQVSHLSRPSHHLKARVPARGALTTKPASIPAQDDEQHSQYASAPPPVVHKQHTSDAAQKHMRTLTRAESR